MYESLSKADTETSKIKVDFIKNSVTSLKKVIEKMSRDDVDKTEKMNEIADIVELILYIKEEKQ